VRYICRFHDHIPLRETTLLRKQVGEGASPRLDAGDRMAHALKSIKALVRRAERSPQYRPCAPAVGADWSAGRHRK
jgi:hypothetical protein